MSFYKNINVIRLISDLKNGLPITALIKHKALKTASKNFYFIKESVNPQIFEILKDKTFISTKERKLYGKDNFEFKVAEEGGIEDSILNLAKCGELDLMLVRTSELPSIFEKTEIFEAEEGSINDFLQNFVYELNLISKSAIQLKQAEMAEFFVFRTKFFGKEHYVIKIKNPERDKAPLVRIHSSCYTGDLLASLRCDCRDQLQDAIRQIAQAQGFNGGYILYLMQEGRSIGLANKIKAYNFQQSLNMDTIESNLCLGYAEDERNFTSAKKLLDFFEIKKITLITNNPKKAEDIKKLGIEVEKTIHTVFAENDYNKDYLNVKAVKMNHSFKE